MRRRYGATNHCDRDQRPIRIIHYRRPSNSMWLAPSHFTWEHAAIGFIDARPKAVAHLSDECHELLRPKSLVAERVRAERLTRASLKSCQLVPRGATFPWPDCRRDSFFTLFFVKKAKKEASSRWTTLIGASRIRKCGEFSCVLTRRFHRSGFVTEMRWLRCPSLRIEHCWT